MIRHDTHEPRQAFEIRGQMLTEPLRSVSRFPRLEQGDPIPQNAGLFFDSSTVEPEVAWCQSPWNKVLLPTTIATFMSCSPRTVLSTSNAKDAIQRQTDFSFKFCIAFLPRVTEQTLRVQCFVVPVLDWQFSATHGGLPGDFDQQLETAQFSIAPIEDASA